LGVMDPELERAAALARLRLSHEEAERLLADVKKVLAYARVLSEARGGPAPPREEQRRAPEGLAARRAEAPIPSGDEHRPPLGARRAVARAPDSEEGFFRVPRVFEGE